MNLVNLIETATVVFSVILANFLYVRMIIAILNFRKGHLLTYKLFEKLGNSALSKAEYISYGVHPQSKMVHVNVLLEDESNNMKKYDYHTYENKYRNMEPHTELSVYCLKECLKVEKFSKELIKLKQDIVERELGIRINKGTAKALEVIISTDDIFFYKKYKITYQIADIIFITSFGIADILFTVFVFGGVIG